MYRHSKRSARSPLKSSKFSVSSANHDSIRASWGKDEVDSQQSQVATMNRPGTGSLHVQAEGYMWKKPFGRRPDTIGSNWRRRYFVLKDSFLMWYKKRPGSNANFSMHPQGCIPIGGCKVFPGGMDERGYLIEITHPDFNGRMMRLKLESEDDAQSWMEILERCRMVTYENAQYGDAQMAQLSGMGSDLEQETLRALELAQKKAEEADEIAKSRLTLMEENLKNRIIYKEELKKRRIQSQIVEKRMTQRLESMAANRRQRELEQMQADSLEQAVLEAQRAVTNLKSILGGENSISNKAELLQDVDRIATLLNIKQEETLSFDDY